MNRRWVHGFQIHNDFILFIESLMILNLSFDFCKFNLDKRNTTKNII